MIEKKAKKPRQRREKVSLTEEQYQKAAEKLAERKNKNPDAFVLPVSRRTIDDLASYFAADDKDTKRILPLEKRRYAIYLRKSTDDEAKQVRSLDDQRSECLELASRMGITVRSEDILEESASAKKSGNRPIFDDMILGFKTGKYHGLISWSPDRISRNMKEAGEVIELIDHEYIQDLQFKTYQFENNPNGKMLLGILFATSKQYSDKLSVDVKRGTDGNIKEGKYNGVIKKGYYVDASNGFFIPDSYNWDLLREAVNMRLYQNKDNVEIAKFLNDSLLSQRKSQDEPFTKVFVDKQMVGDIFKDSFYFGLYKYGDNLADLTEVSDFLPLITPDEYLALNHQVGTDFGVKQTRRKPNYDKLDFGLLRNKVVCDFCDVPMQFQHNPIKRGKNTGKWVVSFYCRNKACQRYKTEENKANGITLKKSIRAKYILAAIEWELRHCTKRSKKAYQLHVDKLRNRIAQDTAIARRKLAEAKNDLRINEKQYMKYQDFQVNQPEDYKRHHQGKLEHHQQLINVAEHSIKKHTQELEQLKAGLPTEDEFYELIDLYLLSMLNFNDLVELDAICNELVSNLRAGNDSVSVIKLNPPYNLLVDLGEISSGRGERTRTFDLTVPNRARYQLRHTPMM